MGQRLDMFKTLLQVMSHAKTPYIFMTATPVNLSPCSNILTYAHLPAQALAISILTFWGVVAGNSESDPVSFLRDSRLKLPFSGMSCLNAMLTHVPCQALLQSDPTSGWILNSRFADLSTSLSV